jgi:D-3-phosphoglycerate dehydrogenase
MPRTLFIDSTPDIDRVWKKVHGPGDVEIAINMGPVAEADIP